MTNLTNKEDCFEYLQHPYFSRLNTLQGTLKAPAVRLITLRGTKTAFSNSKTYDEHPRSYWYGSPPGACCPPPPHPLSTIKKSNMTLIFLLHFWDTSSELARGLSLRKKCGKGPQTKMLLVYIESALNHCTIYYILLFEFYILKVTNPAYNRANLGGLYYLHSYILNKKWF